MWTLVKLSLVLSVFVSALSQNLPENSICNGNRPRISVENGVSIKENTEDFTLLSYGEDLQLFCSGSASENLSITRVIDEDLEEYLITKVINDTTISWFVEKPPKMSMKYKCVDIEEPCTDSADVLIDSDPELKGFNCKSSNFAQLNCSWSSSTVTPRFALFNIKAGQSTVLCKLQGRSDLIVTPITTTIDTTYFCTWHLTNAAPRYEPKEETIAFLMQTCNAFGCRNDSFSVDHYSVLKLDAPRDLVVLQRRSHSVKLSWSVPYESWRYISKTGVEHKVEYTRISKDSRGKRTEVNTSSWPSGHLTYEIELNLPYAGTRYEARIAIKPKTASDEFWSDFANISFVTREENEPIIISNSRKNYWEISILKSED